MSIKSSLRNLVTELGGSSTAKTTAGILGEIAVVLGGSGEGRTIEGQIDNIVAAKNPLSALTIDATIGVSEDLLGKVVGDLQSSIVIGDGTISGTLKYVTGYTGFDESHEELQSGNFIALHVSVPEVTGVTIQSTLSYPVTLDADGIIVLRIKDKDSQKITFTATKEGHVPFSKTFTLKGLTCETEDDT